MTRDRPLAGAVMTVRAQTEAVMSRGRSHAEAVTVGRAWTAAPPRPRRAVVAVAAAPPRRVMVAVAAAQPRLPVVPVAAA